MINKTIKCSVLLKLRPREKYRQQCDRPATHIRRIVGRVAIVTCDLDHGQNPDIADTGFVDLIDLPPHLRVVASRQIETQLKELDREIGEMQQRRDKLAAEAAHLAGLDAPRPTTA